MNFCLDILFIIGVLESPTVIVELSISPSIMSIFDLKYLSNKSSVWASLVMVSINFFPVNEPYFILFIPCEFLVKTGHFEYYDVSIWESDPPPKFCCC